MSRSAGNAQGRIYDPEVVGSNPTPATQKAPLEDGFARHAPAAIVAPQRRTQTRSARLENDERFHGTPPATPQKLSGKAAAA
jgi:hypothetical protein